MTLIEKVINLATNLNLVHLVEFLLFTFAFFFVLNVLRKNNAKLLTIVFVLYSLVVACLSYMLLVQTSRLISVANSITTAKTNTANKIITAYTGKSSI